MLKSNSKRREFEDKHIDTINVSWTRSPTFWICNCMIYMALAGIVSPSLIALSFVLMCAVTMMSWTWQSSCHSWIVSIVTSLGILVSAIYIMSSFIIQISFFNYEKYSWLIWTGIANFSDKKNTEEIPTIKMWETVVEYILAIAVYIT